MVSQAQGTSASSPYNLPVNSAALMREAAIATAASADRHGEFNLCHTSFVGHIGLRLENTAHTLWYPVDQTTKNVLQGVMADVARVQFNHAWISFVSLANRAVVVDLSKVKRMLFEGKGCSAKSCGDRFSDQLHELPFPSRYAEILICESGVDLPQVSYSQREVDEALEFFRKEGLKGEQLLKEIASTWVFYADGERQQLTPKFEELKKLYDMAEMTRLDAIELTEAQGREIILNPAKAALIEMPLAALRHPA